MKKMHPTWGKIQKKKSEFWVFSTTYIRVLVLKYPNTKMHSITPFYRETGEHYLKELIWVLLMFLRTIKKKAKMHAKYVILRNVNSLWKNSIMGVFNLFRY